MRQSIYGIILLILIGCSSTPEISRATPKPSKTDACAKYKGTQFFDCLKAEKRLWEKREGAEGVFRVLSEKREGDYIVYRIEVCWEDFCREFSYKDYDASFWTELKRGGVIGVVSFLAGLITGVFAI